MDTSTSASETAKTSSEVAEDDQPEKSAESPMESLPIVFPKRTQSFDSQHSKKIVVNLNNFRVTNTNCCDAVLEADGEKFEVHKCVLSTMSDYFDKLFNVEMQEKYGETIKLTDISAGTLKLILDFIYTSKITLDNENVYQVLAAADYLMIPRSNSCVLDLKDFCCEFLIDEQHPGNSLKIWTSAIKFNSNQLEEKSGLYISDHFIEISKENDFLKLELEEFKPVVQLKNKNVKKEEDAYTLIVSWVKQDKEKRKSYFPELFSMLDLKKISKYFFSQAVQDKDILLDDHNTTKKVVGRISEQVLIQDRRELDPSTCLLVLCSYGTVKKFDVRSRFKENVSLKEFSGYAGAVKMQNCIYLLGTSDRTTCFAFSSSFGYRTTGNSSTDVVQKLNVKTPTAGWKKETSLPVQCENIMATVMNDSQILAWKDDSYANTYMFDAATRTWTNFSNIRSRESHTCLGATSERVYRFPSWQYWNVEFKTWLPAAKKIENVELGVASMDDMYLFAQEGSNFCLWLYHKQKATTSKLSTLTDISQVRDACLVRRNIVAVVCSKHEGWLLKEFSLNTRTWRVITGIDGNDFARIFPLE